MTCSTQGVNHHNVIKLSNRPTGRRGNPRAVGSINSAIIPDNRQVVVHGLRKAGRRRLMVMSIAALLGGLGAVGSLQARPAEQHLANSASQAVLSPALTTPAKARTGTLLLKGEVEGTFVEAPRLGTDADITVSGPTARGRITQHFVNPTNGWVEAVYVFPLPETAAVDTLKMVIGERIIVGDIKERREAKIIYERAKAAGKKAALLEQERPNMFTHSIANIGPGETIVLQLEYQQTVPQSGNTFSLRFPMVVGPRYNPKPIVQTVDFNPRGGGWGQLLDPVPDRERISPPVLDPAKSPPVNPVTLTVRLQAGFPLGEVKSPHHKIDIEETSDSVREIKLSAGSTPANRDFELTWTPKGGGAPSVGLFHERVGDADYVLAMVTPPQADADTQAPGNGDEANEQQPPREVIFVIDNSGSMGGTSIAQAKTSLIYGLNRLTPRDRFNVIRFDNTFDLMFPTSVAADTRNVDRAVSFVSGLQARGGTEMVQPMAAALEAGNATKKSGFLRQVIFLTDGAIGNEDQLFDVIANRRGRSRVFMVGIGSAPNSHLMSRAAEIGRGTVTHIGSADQVQTRMQELFSKLENPVVTNLKASFTGTSAEATPGLLPDLYQGEPVVLAAKLTGTTGRLQLSGQIGERPWSVKIPLSGAAPGLGISKIWARRKISDAEVDKRLGRLSFADADTKVLRLALDHHLVSRMTSLVAVDQSPTRPDGAQLTRADVPLNLPEGWDFEKVFGKRAPDDRAGDSLRNPGDPAARREKASLEPATDNARVQLAAFKKIAVASKPTPNAMLGLQNMYGVNLPQTATDAEQKLILGLVLILLGLARWMRWSWRSIFPHVG